MSKVKLASPFKILSGKISQNSDMMLVTNSITEETFTRRIGKRDLDKHPVTECEKELHSKMHDGIMAYHNLKDNVEGYAAFLENYRQVITLLLKHTIKNSPISRKSPIINQKSANKFAYIKKKSYLCREKVNVYGESTSFFCFNCQLQQL